MNLNKILDILKNNFEIILGVNLIVLILVIILLIVTLVKLYNLKKQYSLLMKGSNSKSIEKLVHEFKDLAKDANDQSVIALDGVKLLNNQIQNCVQKVGIVRFKAFEDVGSNQSYSIALLDNKNDGVIITSIFGRDINTSYAKPINKGNSEYALSEEEYLAVERALGISKK